MILETQDLHKQFGDNHAVQGISFGILEGEVFSLLGPNGAGKTTTISMLSCLLTPTSGDATIGGHSVRQEPQAVKQLIGVVPQEIALYATLTARENLVFWGQMYGMGGAALRQRVDEVLETVGLKDRAKERIETFSGGMKRRINIGVGLLHRPRLVFMDEPTVGIDPQSRRNILDMVQALNEQGMTVLYTTHYMEEAQELSNRIGIIDHGKLIALGTLAELTRMVGQEDVVELGIDAEHSSPELVAALGQVAGVRQALAENGTVRLVVADGNAALPELMLVTNQMNVRVTNVAIQEPNLEAVFLHLTGRALRD
ncbi:MAG: ATP-binding cassette domain-containing protein [Ardenticatenaceae bacterium]|nr:ATP-binding cassette domain-containing protein [Anaerolineales bacterium]MCB8919350.1 ATP-binding cassette domain-containing protein [Ardenticatenaceae bacterium]